MRRKTWHWRPGRLTCPRIDNRHIYAYSFGMRRRKNTLIPIEIAILDALLGLKQSGTELAHGFLIARLIQNADNARHLTAHGTLYRALHRLERGGFLESVWEEPSIALRDGRPVRKFYRVTAAGENALVGAPVAPSRQERLNPGSAIA